MIDLGCYVICVILIGKGDKGECIKLVMVEVVK